MSYYWAHASFYLRKLVYYITELSKYTMINLIQDFTISIVKEGTVAVIFLLRQYTSYRYLPMSYIDLITYVSITAI